MSKPKQPPHRNYVHICMSTDLSQGFDELSRESVGKLVKGLKSYLRRYHNYGQKWRMTYGGAAYRTAYVQVPNGFVEPTVKFLNRRGFQLWKP